MAGAGYRDWSAGEKPTAAQFDTYLQEQTVMVFASAAARNSALTSVLAEGMQAFLLDSNTLTVYSGSAWSTVGPVHGAGSTWTPTVTQSGSVSNTPTTRVHRLGRLVRAEFAIAMTGTGTAANDITVSLPFTAAGNNENTVIGSARFYDSSAGTQWTTLQLLLASSTTFKLSTATSGGASIPYLGSSSFTAALASGDTIAGYLSYEAAADA